MVESSSFRLSVILGDQAVFEFLRKKFREVLFRMLSEAYLSVNLDKQVPLRAVLVLVLWFKVFQLVLHGLDVLCRILSAVLESENLKLCNFNNRFQIIAVFSIAFGEKINEMFEGGGRTIRRRMISKMEKLWTPTKVQSTNSPSSRPSPSVRYFSATKLSKSIRFSNWYWKSETLCHFYFFWRHLQFFLCVYVLKL